MTHQAKTLQEYEPHEYDQYTVAELDRELLIRGAQIPEAKKTEIGDVAGTPQQDSKNLQIKEIYETAEKQKPNKALQHLSTAELVEILLFKTGRIELDELRGVWGKDSRKEYYEIEDQHAKKNAGGIAAICTRKNLLELPGQQSMLKVKTYGEAHNLVSSEPFREQPAALLFMFTGFLVAEDVIATAGHCVNEQNVKDLRIIFGFRKEAEDITNTRIPHENMYKGEKVIRKEYNSRWGNMSDWALVKLDRPVKDRQKVTLSRENIPTGGTVYIMGHPCGLPLKYAPGASVQSINEIYFAADLDVYCGSSGSPVFDSKTHEVVGIVVRGDSRDFRWTGNGYASIIYPDPKLVSREPQCTRVSQFSQYCSQTLSEKEG